MRALIHTSRFRKDYKKRRHDPKLDELLEAVLGMLASEQILPAAWRDHALAGEFKGCRECHLKPDLLLIYQVAGAEVILRRLGSHSELFA
jgi:mRNA interferase YafQ